MDRRTLGILIISFILVFLLLHKENLCGLINRDEL